MGSVFAVNKPRRVQQMWQDVAGAGDAVSGAVDLIRMPKIIAKARADWLGRGASSAAKLGRAGRALGKAAERLGKIAAPLAIVGGTYTAINEGGKFLNDLRDDGKLSEEGALAAANAVAGLASVVGGAMLVIPGLQPFAPVAFAISGIIQGATWVYGNRKRIAKFARAAGKNLSQWAGRTRAKMVNAFKAGGKAIGRAMSAARKKLSSRFSAMRTALRTKARSFTRAAKTAFSTVRKTASRLKGSVNRLKKGLGHLFKRRPSAARANPRVRRTSRRASRPSRHRSPRFSRRRGLSYRGRSYRGRPGR
jgi:hypothetical protein